MTAGASPRAGEPEFFVGYLPDMPPRLARRMRRLAGTLAALAVAVAAAVALAHERLAPASFELGTRRTFTGVVRTRPCPLLTVERPGAGAGIAARSAYLVVLPGKHGALAELAPFDGAFVQLSGALVYRGGRTMIELVPGSPRRVDAAPPPAPLPREELGSTTLAGEIVDSKCFWGVMNPGHRKPHRACAVRCISGGIPPLLRVRGEDGGVFEVLLVGAAGAPIHDALLDFVAEPVELTGELVRQGDVLVLEADPATIRRLP